MLSLILILLIVVGVLLFGGLVALVYFLVRNLQKRDETTIRESQDPNQK